MSTKLPNARTASTMSRSHQNCGLSNGQNRSLDMSQPESFPQNRSLDMSQPESSHQSCGPSNGHNKSLDCLASLAAPPFARLDGANALSYGRLLHAHLLEQTAGARTVTDAHLAQMYCKCGCLEDANNIFCALHPRPSVPTWNAMISMHIRHGFVYDAQQIFNQMLIEGYMPTSFTFTSLTSGLTSRAALADCHRLHLRVKNSTMSADVFVSTALVFMYGKCSSLDDMRLVFDSMPFRDVISWTALITAYVQHEKYKQALEVFFLMQDANVTPTRVTFITILSACSSKDFLPIGKGIHDCMKRSGFESDVNLGNALLSMYGKCGSVENAREVFDSMEEPNLISWNAIIAVYAQSGNGEEALSVAQCMQQRMLQDDISYISILDACTNAGSLSYGKQTHARIPESRLEGNITLGNSLVNMYGKCDSLDEAVQVFHTMHEHDQISWNALVSVFSSKEKGIEALQSFDGMQQEGFMPNRITFVSAFTACASLGALICGKRLHCMIANGKHELDVVVGTAIVNMYGKSHSSVHARQIFDVMPVQNIVCWTAMISAYALNEQLDEAFTLFNSLNERQDVILWNSLMAAFSQNQQSKKALALFDRMSQEGILPDRVTFVSCLEAATSEAILRYGKWLHSQIRYTSFEKDNIIQNSLVSMYGRCGTLETAWKVFGQLQTRTVFAWSSMIAAYGQKGLGKEALGVFKQMQEDGVKPDKITFINILSACSHAGLVREACKQFTSMQDNYGIEPMADHYNCIIDLLGRSGQLAEAESLVRNMKGETTPITWLTFLGACRNNVDVIRGEWAAESLFKLDPDNAAPYVLLSSLYAAAVRVSDASNVIHEMNCKGLKH